MRISDWSSDVCSSDLLTAHHIVCDGWSWWVLTRELAALYARRLGVPTELSPADDFADYALAEAKRRADASCAEDEAYWLSRLAGEMPVLALPPDRPPPTSEERTVRTEGLRPFESGGTAAH